MYRYIIRRLIFAIPVLLVSSVLVFAVVRSTFDPLGGAVINPRVSPADILRVKHELGLDRSPMEQYLTWLAKFVRADWGKSLLSNRPVYPDIRSAMANTVVLGGIGVVFSLLVGVGIGVYSALRQYSWFDHFSTSVAFVGLSMPNFWFALLLQIFFGIYISKWFHLTSPIFYTAGITAPGSSGFDALDRLRHLVLPMLVLSVQIIAVYSRYMRASML